MINKQTDTIAITLYSIKKDTGHETPKDKSTNKKNYEIIPTPCPSTHTLIWINRPPPPINLCHLPIIHNNNTMDTEFLVQMRQSNKCGNVRNDEIFNLHLGSGAGSWVSIPCLLQDTSHIYWFHPPKQLTRKKQRTQKWDSTPNKSYCTALVYIHRTQG